MLIARYAALEFGFWFTGWESQRCTSLDEKDHGVYDSHDHLWDERMCIYLLVIIQYPKT